MVTRLPVVYNTLAQPSNQIDAAASLMGDATKPEE